MLLSFFLCHSQYKGIPDVVEVVNGVQLWDASLQHHGQKVNEQGRPPPQSQIGILTESDKPGNEVHVNCVCGCVCVGGDGMCVRVCVCVQVCEVFVLKSRLCSRLNISQR